MKIGMKIVLHYQRRGCSPMTLVSDNIRFIVLYGYSRGFPEGASNDSRVIENIDCQGFRHLRQSSSSSFICPEYATATAITVNTL